MPFCCDVCAMLQQVETGSRNSALNTIFRTVLDEFAGHELTTSITIHAFESSILLGLDECFLLEELFIEL